MNLIGFLIVLTLVAIGLISSKPPSIFLERRRS